MRDAIGSHQPRAVARHQPDRRQQDGNREPARQFTPDRGGCRAAAGSAQRTRPASRDATAASPASAGPPGFDAARRCASRTAPSNLPPEGARPTALPRRTAAYRRRDRYLPEPANRQHREIHIMFAPYGSRPAGPRCGIPPVLGLNNRQRAAEMGGHHAGRGASHCGKICPPIRAGGVALPDDPGSVRPSRVGIASSSM